MKWLKVAMLIGIGIYLIRSQSSSNSKAGFFSPVSMNTPAPTASASLSVEAPQPSHAPLDQTDPQTHSAVIPSPSNSYDAGFATTDSVRHAAAGAANEPIEYRSETEEALASAQSLQSSGRPKLTQPALSTVTSVPLHLLGGDGTTDRNGNILGWFDASRAPEHYEVSLGPVAGEGSTPIALVRALNDNPSPWGSLAYNIDVDTVAGKSLEISALIKSDEADSGSFWASAFREASEQPIAHEKLDFQGSFGWQNMGVMISIPWSARKVQVGITLNGRRRILMKDLVLRIRP